VGKKIPDRELEEPLSSSGREERKVLCERMCMMKATCAFAPEWYQSFD
jgi:hypothetical protein